jgi:two-component system, NarL family, invasion response regulator UvrY
VPGTGDGILVPGRGAGDARGVTVPADAPERPAETPVPTRVLVVDDQAPFRSAARLLVGLLPGWEVVAEAETGEDAVRLAAELRPDVVLMDINLPGLNGIESTRALLAVQPAAAVVLTSTYAAADLPAGADDCGAVGYLRKEELTPRLLRELVSGGSTGSGTRPVTEVPLPGADST